MKFGNKDDSDVINYAICSGVKGIFTAHGSNYQDLKLNPEINRLINMGVFEKIIFLDSVKKGTIKKVI
ncbi:MAG: hypothetical protein K6B70_02930 [Clostridia bacterium]|nr:hypothetical protein [Clostridia bacterium]